MLKQFLKKIFGGGGAGVSSDGFFLNVRCSQCKEEFHLFVNTATDLAQDFSEDGKLTYFLNKEIIGSNCRSLIRVHMKFGGTKKPVSRKIENGEFID
jgi:hypothetical protein